MIIRTSKLQENTTLTEEDGRFVLRKAVDIEPVLAADYEARKDQQDGWTKDRSMRRVASVPFDTWFQWTRQHPEIVVGDKELREKTLRALLYREENKLFWTVERGL